jgi:hypothetical protein
MTSETAESKYCSATTSKGLPCKAFRTANSPFCVYHGDKEKLREAGRKGAQIKASKDHSWFDMGIKNKEDLEGFLKTVMIMAAVGEITPEQAEAVKTVANILLTLPTAEVGAHV